MYITQDIEQLGIPACSKVQNEKKKQSERSDVNAKAHSFSPDQETPVSEHLSSENSKY